MSDQVTSNGERLKQGLRDKLSGNAHVKEVRGLGLIVGVQLDQVSSWDQADLGISLPTLPAHGSAYRGWH